MKLTVIGLNHETAPVHIREKLAFSASNLPDAVRELGLNAASEVVILSTCNRTELYCVGDSEVIIQWLAKYHQLAVENIRPYLYVLGCSETIRHAFRVACGLDSMVLGEPQILGQMKDAVQIAREQNTMSTWLNALFQRTFAAAKEIRSYTNIGNNVVSMASAAVRMAENSLGDISQLNVLFVGAGEMNESVATYFAAKQPKKLAIINRTLNRAIKLCNRLNFDGAQAYSLDLLPEILSTYDVVISCTSSNHYIISKKMMQIAMKQRVQHPVFMLDLAVPRDIESEVSTLPNIELYTVDDTAEIVNEGRKLRRSAAEMAETMVQQKVNDFVSWQQRRTRVPLICALRDEGEKARLQVLNNALRQLSKGTPAEEVLERLSIQLTNKLLHSPTRALNQAGVHDAHVVKTLSQVYDL